MHATHNPTLRLRSTCAAVHVSAYFAISFRKMTSTSSEVSLTTCMSDEHVSYKAILQQPAPILGPLWARQPNAFRIVFFWQAKSGPILRAYWELFDHFLSLHAFIPRPRLWRGATGNRKVIGVSPTQKRFGISAFFCKERHS